MERSSNSDKAGMLGDVAALLSLVSGIVYFLSSHAVRQYFEVFLPENFGKLLQLLGG
jgi:hypothetical protein